MNEIITYVKAYLYMYETHRPGSLAHITVFYEFS
jgi:hypothetical protein